MKTLYAKPKQTTKEFSKGNLYEINLASLKGNPEFMAIKLKSEWVIVEGKDFEIVEDVFSEEGAKDISKDLTQNAPD